MKPMRLPAGPGLNGRTRPTAIAIGQMALAEPLFAALSACEQSSFVPPPPPKTDAGLPLLQGQHRPFRL
jgi:hypothetical protein